MSGTGAMLSCGGYFLPVVALLLTPLLPLSSPAIKARGHLPVILAGEGLLPTKSE